MFAFYFAWYQGAVYSNLLASGICAGVVWWRARVHLRRARETRSEDLAEQLAKHRQAVADDVRRQLAEHHAAIVAAVTEGRDR